MSSQASIQVKSRLELTRIKAMGAAVMLIAMSAVPGGGGRIASVRPAARNAEGTFQTIKEEPIALGLANEGSVIEVLTSDGGSTWTIMISRPNGSSCLVAAGEGWEQGKIAAKGERGA